MSVVHQITDPSAIRTHLQDVSGLRVPLHGTIQGGHRLFNCRLIYPGEKNNGPIVKVPLGTIPLKGRITLSYTTIHSPFTFSSSINSGRRLDPQHTLLNIRLPDSVKQFNRRKYIRIQPPPNAPVILDLDLPDETFFYPEVADISGGGLAFIVPSRMEYFDIGKQYPARLCIPDIGEISSHIASRNLRKIFRMFRVGAEFVGISEKDRKLIEAYTIERKTALPENSPNTGLIKPPRVLILDAPGHASLYRFLEGSCDVKHAAPESALDAAASHSPELIVLNLDFPESAAAFMAARDHEALKERPMILVSARERELFFQVPEWHFMSIPFRESLFSQKAMQLISDYWRSNKLEALQSMGLSERKILILDFPRTFSFKMMDYLKAHRYKVSVIYHTKDVLRRIAQMAPRIILINANVNSAMKDICKLMKLNRSLRSIPKILLYDGDGTHDLTAQGLVTIALTNPVDADELLKRIRQYI